MSERALTEITRYMLRNINKTLTLDDLCQEFGYSKSHMNNLFRKYTRLPPIDFFHSIKIEQACVMLRSSNKMIYEIAADLGYSDQYYFSRVFRKIVGVSPREYRKTP